MMNPLHAAPFELDQYRISDEAELRAASPPGATSGISMTLGEWTALEKASLAESHPSIFRVDDETPIGEIIRAPNARDGDVDGLARTANGGRAALPRRYWFGGRLVSQGMVQIVRNNGRVEVVPPGRWGMGMFSFAACMASWGDLHSVTRDHISDDTFTMVRVHRGMIGLATENGRPVLLSEGLHVYNSPLFAFHECKPVGSEHIAHRSFTLLRVPKGQFAKVTEQGKAKLLPEGMHVIDNPVFRYDGLVSAREPYIAHDSIHVIQVPKGSLCLICEASNPRLLHEGLHIFDSPLLTCAGVRSKMEPLITHGTISRFRIPKGEIGLAWHENRPLFIETPGTYHVDSASFRFVESKPAAQKRLVLGSHKIITVFSGEVGVSFDAGRLAILPPGRHVIDAAEHTFDDFLSTQQRSMRLTQATHDDGGRGGVGEATATSSKGSKGKGGGGGGDLLVCETKDLVKIGIRADVFYRIADPEKAILQVGRADIESLIMETSIATLTNIMRTTPLNDIAQSTAVSAVSTKAAEADARAATAAGEPTAPLFFDQAHDQFLSKLHDDFLDKYGLEVSNIRIEQFKIMDDALASSISQQAVATAETESKLANLAGQTQIAKEQQERDAAIRQIQAQSEAQVRRVAADAEVAQAEAETRAQQVRAQAEAVRHRTMAEGEAAATRIRAEATIAEADAEAKGTKIRADASVSEATAVAESVRLRAAAEAERASMLAATGPLGEKLALLEVYAGVVKSSNEGVQKVVYVDPGTTHAANPLGLLTLQSLQTDLKALGAGGGEP